MLRATILLTLLAIILGEDCTSPTLSTYTSKNVALSTITAYVADFTVNCRNSKGLNLYAEVETGLLVPVASVPDSSNYQISWVKDHKKAETGIIKVKIFNEDGHVAYRKAQRSNEDVSKVEAFLTIDIHHPGVSREGLFLQTEFVAVVCGLLIWWTANSMKNQIME